ncbi:8687_t:CDS:1, partial [Racocetra persica]
MENRIKELENKVLEQQKEKEECLRKAVNAEISKVEKENE